MASTPWDGVMPGGRFHRPRGRRDGRTRKDPSRSSAAAARVLRLAPGRRGAVRLAAVALSVATLAAAQAAGGTPEAGAAPVARAHANAASLDERVRLLSAELQLTPEQQLKVRALLQVQREQVRQIWSDASVPPAMRIGRTQDVRDRTVESIRDLLDEAQRRHYIQPLQRAAAVGTAGADVQSWMDKGAGR